MLQRSSLSFWADMKHFFEYLLILMKTIKTNDQKAEKSTDILAKLLLSHLIVAQEYRTCYHSNA